VEYIAFLQSLESPSTKPHNADQLLEMLGMSHRTYIIFRHHFADIIQVASTERPAMPTSAPLLDALEVEKSAAPWDKEAIERNHPHYKDAAQASNKKNAAGTSGATSEANQGGNSSAPLGK
jgi:regulator of nonsense transcripts 3